VGGRCPDVCGTSVMIMGTYMCCMFCAPGSKSEVASLKLASAGTQFGNGAAMPSTHVNHGTASSCVV
jgi:hypothetical protein